MHSFDIFKRRSRLIKMPKIKDIGSGCVWYSTYDKEKKRALLQEMLKLQAHMSLNVFYSWTYEQLLGLTWNKIVCNDRPKEDRFFNLSRSAVFDIGVTFGKVRSPFVLDK